MDDHFEANHLVHAQIIIGVKGDGSIGGIRVEFIDPDTGSTGSEDFSTFARKLEAPETVQFGDGIFHW